MMTKLEKKARKNRSRNYVAGLFDVEERHAKLTLLGEVLFKRFHEQLAAKGLAARGGQMVDATFVLGAKLDL